MDGFQRLEPPISGGDNFVWISFPFEGLGVVGVVFVDEPIDRGLQIDQRIEDSVFESAVGQFSEEALDRVQPRA